VENTHEAIIDKDTFGTVQMLLSKRRKIRERTHNYLLKGLIYCHECGYVMSVINRKLAKNREVLYFVCRTYQRFTNEKKCTVHYAKVEDVTNAVLNQVKQVCVKYLNLAEMQNIAEIEIAKCKANSKGENEIKELESKIEFLTGKLDQVYTDKLYGVLSPKDFERIYGKLKEDRENMTEKLKILKLKSENKVDNREKAKELAGKFISEIEINKELVFSLIERIELTSDKQVIIYWAFSEFNQV
ncbi:MAG: zinc ribbon domain-containing protein, partial [Oscillospiraceae bacterium]|nr:zinc ribbon domain-containing protein [Oscillospiraceae bacterium]